MNESNLATLDEALAAMVGGLTRNGLTWPQWNDRSMTIIREAFSDGEKRTATKSFLRLNTAHEVEGVPLSSLLDDRVWLTLVSWYRGEHPERWAHDVLRSYGRTPPPHIRPIK